MLTPSLGSDDAGSDPLNHVVSRVIGRVFLNQMWYDDSWKNVAAEMTIPILMATNVLYSPLKLLLKRDTGISLLIVPYDRCRGTVPIVIGSSTSNRGTPPESHEDSEI